ncbi:hypothetical protein BU17DRAFT_62550 [Hysterangium stoloniferum]|nr:hypothetical protein BU17DRAFT_62550 [Hysterangium stoloniferum]
MPKPEPASIYLSLFVSDTGREAYNWALFVSCSTPSIGRLFRVAPSPSADHLGFESKEYDLSGDQCLFLLLKLGSLGRMTIDDIQPILEKVTIPDPNDEYSHLFDDRTWVIKAIMRLSAYGIIESRKLESMEDDIQSIAAHAFYVHEQGRGWTIATFECK